MQAPQSSDIALVHDSTAIKESQQLKALLSNEYFLVTCINASTEKLRTLADPADGGFSGAIIIVSSTDSDPQLIGTVDSWAEKVTTHVLRLKKTIVVSAAGSTELDTGCLQFSRIEHNDELKRAVNALLDKADLVNRTFSESGRILDYEKTLRVYADTQFAGDYYEKWKDNVPASRLDYFAKLFPDGAVILDAGCGPGHHSKYLANFGFEVIGIDLSAAALRIANDNASSETTFLRRDMLRSGLAAGSFHGIWSCASVIHMPRIFLRDAFAEFSRLLAPGGILGLSLAIGERQHHDAYGRFFESFDSKELIADLLAEFNFSLIGSQDSISWASTQNDFRAVNWVTFYGQKSVR